MVETASPGEYGKYAWLEVAERDILTGPIGIVLVNPVTPTVHSGVTCK